MESLVSSITGKTLTGLWLYIWVTRWVSYKKQELLTLREHLNSLTVCWWGPSFCVLSYYVSLRFVLWYPLWFPHENDVQFGSSFTSSCLLEGLCLLAYSGVQHIVLCFLFYFSSSCVLYVASFSWWPLRYSLMVILSIFNVIHSTYITLGFHFIHILLS